MPAPISPPACPIQRPAWAAGAAWLLVSSALAGCGGRSALSIDEAPVGPCAGAADPTTPIELPTLVQTFGDVASSGCSFAATWIENRDGDLLVDAVIFSVSGGAWRASDVITVSAAPDVDLLSSSITWDGSAYDVAWTHGSEVPGGLFLRRIAEDGALLGPPVQSFSIATNPVVTWLDAAGDGTLRVGVVSDPEKEFDYRVYLARITYQGAVLLPPTLVTPTAHYAPGAGFSHRPDGTNALLWTDEDDGADTVDVQLSSVRDDATLVGDPQILLPGVSLATSSYTITNESLAGAGSDLYFGVGVYPADSQGVLVGSLRPAGGFDPVQGVKGGIYPALASTGKGALGALAADMPQGSNLWLSIVTGGATQGATRVATDLDSFESYAIAGGSESLGLLWTSDAGLGFTVKTP